jgi:hypothetical protein
MNVTQLVTTGGIGLQTAVGTIGVGVHVGFRIGGGNGVRVAVGDGTIVGLGAIVAATGVRVGVGVLVTCKTGALAVGLVRFQYAAKRKNPMETASPTSINTVAACIRVFGRTFIRTPNLLGQQPSMGGRHMPNADHTHIGITN